jgi:hypothetical protein
MTQKLDLTKVIIPYIRKRVPAYDTTSIYYSYIHNNYTEANYINFYIGAELIKDLNITIADRFMFAHDGSNKNKWHLIITKNQGVQVKLNKTENGLVIVTNPFIHKNTKMNKIEYAEISIINNKNQRVLSFEVKDCDNDLKRIEA